MALQLWKRQITETLSHKSQMVKVHLLFMMRIKKLRYSSVDIGGNEETDETTVLKYHQELKKNTHLKVVQSSK
jgi:hypothetical protein